MIFWLTELPTCLDSVSLNVLWSPLESPLLLLKFFFVIDRHVVLVEPHLVVVGLLLFEVLELPPRSQESI